MNRIFCIIFAALFALTASSQNLAKDSIALQKIIRKTIGNSTAPGIYEVKEPKDIKFVSGYISARNKTIKPEIKTLSVIDENTLGRRYRNGDKSAIPEILTILGNDNYEAIAKVLEEMSYDYTDNQPVHYLEPELKERIFKLVSNDSVDFAATRYLGENNIDGFVALFEENIRMGISQNPRLIMPWLAKAKSQVAFDYMARELEQGRIAPIGWGASDRFLVHGNDQQKKKLRDLIYAYFSKNPITVDDITHPVIGEFMADERAARSELFANIVAHGDKRSIAFLEKTFSALAIEKLPNVDPQEISAIVQINTLHYKAPAERKAVFLDLLSKKMVLGDAFEKVRSDEVLRNDEEVAQALVSHWFNQKYASNLTIVSYFKDKNQVEFDALVLKSIPDGKKRRDLSEDFAISKKTVQDHSDYLFKNGFIDTPITPQMIEDFKKANFYEPDEQINDIKTTTQIAKIGLSFDAESEIPNDYSTLLSEFVAISKGKLKGIKSYVQAGNYRQGSGYEYRFLVSDGKKSYIVVTQDQGDWYDMETFDKLLDRLTSDAKIEDRFYSISGGNDSFYVFGEPEKIEKLRNDYKLRNSWEIK
ncbi:hypothetical protein HUK80_04800 [Flavobacterium sp. MAH-1]|uniref:Uncharacterized protein n=1 Tax=Flavobacterium agri TaxID=2743471 RepID=A0A7Y9C4U1_9FLAO|nr:hypothetical protein [Flavobacterium agri]NUY80205.1 hypothetical protein [Flavobacterium agri]NYA70230.1 hypothetical protein [Flavobacterium agri]